jgi:large subunit ribosomal protein L2
MGKRIIQQARGAGGPGYRAPSFKYKGRVRHAPPRGETEGTVVDLISCKGHSAPLARVKYTDGSKGLIIAPVGVTIGQKLKVNTMEMQTGNTMALRDIPIGTTICNIELRPGDGGKFCRASGTFARLLSHIGNSATIQLPSKRKKTLPIQCRASVGIVAGGGRPDKPLLRAGTSHYKMKARNKLYPKVRGAAQNAVDHPFGNKRTSRKSKARPIARNAPPGRKVGMIAAKRTGRKVHRAREE